MTHYEYRVIPAPTKGQRAPGVKGPEGRFANAIEGLMNRMGHEGWEYQRADAMPMDVRDGLTGTTTRFQTVLVFRRPARASAEPFEPRLLGAPAPDTAPAPTVIARAAPSRTAPAAAPDQPRETETDSGTDRVDFEPDEPHLDKDDTPNSVLIARAQRLFSKSPKSDPAAD